MRVLVLGTEERKEALSACPFADTLAIEWMHGTGSYTGTADACIDLGFDHSAARIAWLQQTQIPLIVVDAVITTTAGMPENFIRINGWNTFLQRSVIEAAGHPLPGREKAEQLFAALGRTTEWVPDIEGFITPRVVCTIINEAFFALQEKVSTATEIDAAMKTGTNYPYGPFEWASLIGLQQVHSLLSVLAKQESRYTPCTLLTEKATA